MSSGPFTYGCNSISHPAVIKPCALIRHSLGHQDRGQSHRIQPPSNTPPHDSQDLPHPFFVLPLLILPSQRHFQDQDAVNSRDRVAARARGLRRVPPMHRDGGWPGRHRRDASGDVRLSAQRRSELSFQRDEEAPRHAGTCELHVTASTRPPPFAASRCHGPPRPPRPADGQRRAKAERLVDG